MFEHPRHLTSRAHLTSGMIIDGRYTIIDLLGMGGYATVYQARDLLTGQEVALKLLSPWLAYDPDALRDRFIREASLALQIRHPNAVQLYDFGWLDDDLEPTGYLAMERLKGRDLARELCLVGSIKPARALRLLNGCLSALALAHARNIVHGDLKPSNLFIHHRDGQAEESLVLLDFGVARCTANATLETERVGTPQYMAPEYIARGLSTPAADVYQMGLILVEMLTGRVVVDQRTPRQCIHAHTSGRLRLPRALLDSPLGPILMSALALDPTTRYPDARAFQEALERIAPETIQVAPEESSRREVLASISGSVRSIARPDLLQTTSELDPHTGQFWTTSAHQRFGLYPSAHRPIRVTQGATPGSFPAEPERLDEPDRYEDAPETPGQEVAAAQTERPEHQGRTSPVLRGWSSAWGWALIIGLVSALVAALMLMASR